MRIGALLLLCAAAFSCASWPERGARIGNVFDDLVASSPRGATPDVDVLALPDAGHALVRDVVRKHTYPLDRLAALEKLFDEGQPLAMRYDAAATLTVAEAFQRKVGNCLTFTQVFIALAREAGLDARFEEVAIPYTWEQMGAAITLNRHIAVFGFEAGASYEVDFGHLIAGFPAFDKRVVSDRRARAQYFNNLGAEALSRLEFETAIRHLNRALILEPRLSFVWSNLGVALMQVGEVENAERSYLHALELDHFDLSAMSNLVRLYDHVGKPQLAERYRKRVLRYRSHNPYDEYLKGEQALADANYDEARQHFKRALRDKPDEVTFNVALARAYKGLGRDDLAHKWLRRARKLSDEQDDVTDTGVYE